MPDGEPDKLCEKLSLLLGDHARRATMGRRAEQEAQSYDWKKIAAQIVDVYEELVRMKDTEPGVRQRFS